VLLAVGHQMDVDVASYAHQLLDGRAAPQLVQAAVP
jgi:hypothetical protein